MASLIEEIRQCTLPSWWDDNTPVRGLVAERRKISEARRKKLCDFLKAAGPRQLRSDIMNGCGFYHEVARETIKACEANGSIVRGEKDGFFCWSINEDKK